ncbi:MAG: hypothetical protein JWQ20_1937 [Conexibacter sp.]|nr:hypothetical protein [Conexibacter sp.]
MGIDLDALISGLPSAHRHHSPPDDLVSRRMQEVEEHLAAPDDPEPPYSRGGFDWLTNNLVVADPAAGLPDDSELISRELIESDGTDALAWYVPFHRDQYRWGIYLPDRGVWTLAKAVHQYRGAPHDLLACLRLSAKVLFAHEYFHFLTEVVATLLEQTQYQPPENGLYLPYRDQVRTTPAKEGHPVEEALANAYAFDQAGVTLSLIWFAHSQPHGYRDWDMFCTDETFQTGLGRLLFQMIHADYVGGGRHLRTAHPSETLFDLALQAAPVSSVRLHRPHTLRDPAYRLGFVGSVASGELVQSRRFTADLKAAPRHLRDGLAKALEQLETDATIPGLQFKPLKACGQTWSFRVGRDHRAALQRDRAGWTLLAVSVSPDRRYVHPNCRSRQPQRVPVPMGRRDRRPPGGVLRSRDTSPSQPEPTCLHPSGTPPRRASSVRA